MDVEQYDAIVIGAGQAGPGVATHLAGAGRTVALIEADRVGGTCLNRGCRPTKAMRASAKVAHVARTAAPFGVTTGPVTVDLAAVVARKDTMIDGWVDGYAGHLGDVENLTLLYGEARFTGRGEAGFEVGVGDRRLVTDEVFLNVGTRAAAPPIPGLDSVAWLDNDRILHLTELPEHLVVLGGSYIGLEFAQMFARFGSRVTVIERGSQLAGREDADVAAEIERIIRADGVDVCLGATVTGVEPGERSSGLRVCLEGADPVEGSHLLVALGRTPNTDRLGLDTIGLTTDDRGYIATDGVFRTEVAGVWALGDINGRGAFTHTSYQDYEVLVDHLSGGSRTADTRIPTYAMFTDPPLGRVGMSERDAAESGRRYRVATMPMSKVTRAVLDGETDGLIKLIVDADTEQFLGAAALGVSGDEIIQIVSALMHAGATWRVLAEMLPIHPTVAEYYPTILGTVGDPQGG